MSNSVRVIQESGDRSLKRIYVTDKVKGESMGETRYAAVHASVNYFKGHGYVGNVYRTTKGPRSEMFKGLMTDTPPVTGRMTFPATRFGAKALTEVAKAYFEAVQFNLDTLVAWAEEVEPD